jgi:hypothetical protein
VLPAPAPIACCTAAAMATFIPRVQDCTVREPGGAAKGTGLPPVTWAVMPGKESERKHPNPPLPDETMLNWPRPEQEVTASPGRCPGRVGASIFERVTGPQGPAHHQVIFAEGGER